VKLFRNNQFDKQNRPNRRRAITLGLFLGALVAAGVGSLATITTNSEPWAHGHTAKAQHPDTSTVVVGDIWPGDCNDVKLTVSNPMPKDITITGLNNTGLKADDARLLDFLYQTDVSTVLNGKVVGHGQTKSFVVPNAVCDRPGQDDARQDQDFQVGLFVAYQVNVGTEATD
jgi:hypothetical protein